MSAGAPQLPSTRLRAFIERSAPPPQRAPADEAVADDQEHCGLCGLPIPPEHRHVVSLAKRELLCACRACSVLFDHTGAGGGGRHFRLVPDRCLAIDGLRLDDLAWRALGLPVEMAFFIRNGDSGRVTAFYPSPAGPTESELELESWAEIEADNPVLAGMQADVEGLLVDRTGPGTRAFLVGVDECYRLVALVRVHWRGFSGGDEVWRELGRFFAALDARAERGV